VYLGLQIILGKTVELHLALLMSSSHRLLVICSPQKLKTNSWIFIVINDLEECNYGEMMRAKEGVVAIKREIMKA
jgi:hypothetical protein